MLRKLFLIPIRIYRKGISPFTPPACRYTPTCSAYAEEAITRFGAWKGGWLAVRRILRCHPFGSSGYDPVPGSETESGGATQTETVTPTMPASEMVRPS